MFEGIVWRKYWKADSRAYFRVHAPLLSRSDGLYVNLNTGLVEDVISCEPMAKDRQLIWQSSRIKT